jgi:hypothetical protein
MRWLREKWEKVKAWWKHCIIRYNLKLLETEKATRSSKIGFQSFPIRCVLFDDFDAWKTQHLAIWSAPGWHQSGRDLTEGDKPFSFRTRPTPRRTASHIYTISIHILPPAKYTQAMLHHRTVH